jgi:hypothetical protein
LDHDSYILPSISFVVFGTGWLAQINKESQLGLQYSASIVQSANFRQVRSNILMFFFLSETFLPVHRRGEKGKGGEGNQELRAYSAAGVRNT